MSMTMQSNPTLKGIIFDLDGTLLNTLHSVGSSHNRMLAQLNYPSHPINAYRYFIGNGARMCISRCLPSSAQSEEIINNALEIQQADYQTSWHRDVTVYPGVNESLARLKENTTKIAVLSNKDHRFTTQCIHFFFPTPESELFQGHSPDVPHKPDPTGAISIARHFQLDPEEIALIGDSAMDIETALAANMYAVGALWGFRDRQELIDAGANELISEPGQIVTLTAGNH